MSENATVTWWHPVDGYVRSPASAEFQPFLDDRSGGYDGVLHGLGFENVDGTDRQTFQLSVTAYQHETTRELMVDMMNANQGLAQVHVSGDHADGFMFTEYLRIVQQLSHANAGDDLLLIQKAILSFVRHGHGERTISEFGTTMDEMRNEQAARRSREARQKPAG